MKELFPVKSWLQSDSLWLANDLLLVYNFFQAPSKVLCGTHLWHIQPKIGHFWFFPFSVRCNKNLRLFHQSLELRVLQFCLKVSRIHEGNSHLRTQLYWSWETTEHDAGNLVYKKRDLAFYFNANMTRQFPKIFKRGIDTFSRKLIIF